MKERVQGRYEAMVRDALSEVGFPGVELFIEVLPDAQANGADDDPLVTCSIACLTSRTCPTCRRRCSPLEPMPTRTAADLNPRYTFEAFVTGTSNRFAHAAALSVAETPARSYNPLFIYGAAGLGKTHLLHAIGNYVKQNYAHYQVRYVSTEVFLNEFVDAIRTNTGAAFKRRYREIDVLMIDDIQFMESKEGLQEEFFHTFNSLHGANKQIVISSDRQPDAIPTLEDRLRSRFKWGLTTDIQPPDLETRLAILHKKAEKETMTVPDDVMEFIATSITDNIRELEGALTRVLAWASLTHAPLNTARGREGARRHPQQPSAAGDHADADPRQDLDDVQLQRRGPQGQEPAQAARHRPPDRHVRDARAHRPELPGDRPRVRRPRSHDGHPRGREDHGADEGAPADLRPGHRAAPAHPERRVSVVDDVDVEQPVGDLVTSVETTTRFPTRGPSMPRLPVGAWGQRRDNMMGVDLHRHPSIHNPQPLLPLLSLLTNHEGEEQS